MNNPDYLVLNFAQYLDGKVLGSTDIEQILNSPAIMGMCACMKTLYDKDIAMIGTGAKESEMVELPKEKMKVYVR